ncbi:MAG: hypothetical protein H6562_15240 [Lewinellaceae bacterium]|nr:hypothetical protein [Lewinellaceae bacterium]
MKPGLTAYFFFLFVLLLAVSRQGGDHASQTHSARDHQTVNLFIPKAGTVPPTLLSWKKAVLRTGNTRHAFLRRFQFRLTPVAAAVLLKSCRNKIRNTLPGRLLSRRPGPPLSRVSTSDSPPADPVDRA